MKSLDERFQGVCFACGAKYGTFYLSSDDRLCKKRDCLHVGWPKEQHSKLVTIFPDWNVPLNIDVLPSMVSQTNFDIFARWGGNMREFPKNTNVKKKNSHARNGIKQFFPYRRDILGTMKGRLNCGNATCYRSKRLQTWVDQPNIFVLDLSTYRWSNTLKDPRSWAIVNVALENKIRHLALWTAGNAGLSLAKLVRACNYYLPEKKRLRVYALYDRTDKSMDASVKYELKKWECELIPVPNIRKDILPPNKILQKVKDKVLGLREEWIPEEYWMVTDGWEAVGMMMYRLLFAQVMRDLQPTHIIAPLGTGNLVLGIIQGVKDWKYWNKNLDREVTIIGAMPKEDNIIEKIVDMSDTVPKYYVPISNDYDNPIMPKIASTYTPLSRCIHHELDAARLHYVDLTKDDQVDASEALSNPAMDRRILSEPSGLSSFAALPKVADRHLRGNSEEHVLVINSGFGLLSDEEQRFLREASC